MFFMINSRVFLIERTKIKKSTNIEIEFHNECKIAITSKHVESVV